MAKRGMTVGFSLNAEVLPDGVPALREALSDALAVLDRVVDETPCGCNGSPDAPCVRCEAAALVKEVRQ